MSGPGIHSSSRSAPRIVSARSEDKRVKSENCHINIYIQIQTDINTGSDYGSDYGEGYGHIVIGRSLCTAFM